jgi:FO synthase
MNETISRAAGAAHGQEMSPARMEALIGAIGREPFLRTTLYQPAPEERRAAAFAAAPVDDVVNTPLRRKGVAAPGRFATRRNEETVFADR